MTGAGTEFTFYIFPPTFAQLKKLLTYSVLGLFLMVSLGSCGLFRKMTAKSEKTVSTDRNSSVAKASSGARKPSGTVQKGDKKPELNKGIKPTENYTLSLLDNASSQQFKYSILLDVEVEKITNTDLYDLIDQWLGTPYRIGGFTKRGVDCSGFAQNLVGAVYGMYITRTAREQFGECTPISREELQEGDLVFFNTSRGVSHVGVYLHNDKFVHASTSSGVIISDLKEAYWAKRFVGAGRLPNS